MDKLLFILSCTIIQLLLFLSNVNAQQRPKISEHPVDAIAAREEPLTMNCKATGRPVPEISWYHNGTPLVLSERRVILPEGSLFFLRVMQSKRGEKDAGIYWCEARSSAGTAVSKNATLQIAFIQDDFRSVPKDTTTVLGSAVILKCTPPDGLPEPSVLWYKDGKLLNLGKRISMIEKGSILISEVQSSDAGKYNCSAQNMAGSKSADAAFLKVLTPPILVRGPQVTEVIEGEGLDIPCEIKGDPQPIVSWHRESFSLPEGRSRTLLDNTLRIEDARAEDQGNYTCIGYNEGGNVTITIHLSVYATPQFTESPANAAAQIGDTIKLPCKASGRPKTVIIWDKITSAVNPPLIENNVQELNEEKKSKELAKDKIISFRPKKSVLPNNKNYLIDDENENVLSELPVPASNLRITTPYLSLDEPHYNVSENGDLIISAISQKDEGWYVCTAVNEAGSVSKKVSIRIKDKYESSGIDFIQSSSPENIWENRQKIIITTIKPHSWSTLDVSWAITESDLFTTSSITIYYRPVLYKYHNYGCVLTNDYLAVSTSVEQKAHRLKNLKPFMLYEVFATIPKGLGGSISNIRKGRTLHDAPSAPPTDVRIGVINNTAAYVRWLPPPTELINGLLTGYKIQIKSNTTNKILGEMFLNATTQSVVINSLSPGGRYIAKIAPLTAGGMGPFSAPAALHLDSTLIAMPPKTDPTTSWKGSWIPGIVLAILGVCLIGGAIFTVFWAKRNKRNLKAAYPAAPIIYSSDLPDKSINTLWMNDVIVKPTHYLSVPPIPSEYAEVTHVNFTPKVLQNPPPEPYATVTLRHGSTCETHSVDDSPKNKFSVSQSSSDNAIRRSPMSIYEMLPPPPDHPYDSYHKPQANNMTIRTNPSALSPQILRKGFNQPSPVRPLPIWEAMPPAPNFSKNWTQQRQPYHYHQDCAMNEPGIHNLQLQHNDNSNNFSGGGVELSNMTYSNENDYESGSIFHKNMCCDNETSYFTGNGEPTEEYYRNFNMEFFEDQEFEPSTPPPPCQPDIPYNRGNSNSILRILGNSKNGTGGMHHVQDRSLSQKKVFKNASQHQKSRSSSCERDIPQKLSSDDGDSDRDTPKWVTLSRRSRSKSKSIERKFHEP